MRYKLLVVTVTYKPDYDELLAYVDSFLKFNDLGEDAKLVVVDNSPFHFWDVSSFLEQYPMVTYIPNPKNPGFGAANNLGFSIFDSDYVLFINNDVEFLEPVFKPLIAEFEKDSKIGCIGIKQEGGSPSFFKKMTAPQNAQLNIFNERIHFISGAFMFFKSSVFSKIGMFDPMMFMYFEEFDLSERLIANEYKIIFIDSLHFLHKVGDRTKMNEFAAYKGAETFCYVCKKYHTDYRKANKTWLCRMYKLLIYNLLKINIREFFKIIRIINYRNAIIKKYFNGVQNNTGN